LNRSAAVLILLAGLAAPAAARQFIAIDYAKSRVAFAAKQMNAPFEGNFRKFEAKLAWDAAKPENSRAEVVIDVASIDIGDRMFDDEAKSKTFFNAPQFPQARFVSSAVKALGGGRYEAAGKLTIKGIARDVVMPFTVKSEGGASVFDGAVSIRRLDFKIGEGSWTDTGILADDVQVRVRLVAR
jgi:polyisoprenoid-binding protein YceI